MLDAAHLLQDGLELHIRELDAGIDSFEESTQLRLHRCGGLG